MEDHKPNLDRDELRQACFDMAKQILWRRGPVDVEELQELGEQYYEVAADPMTEEFIQSQNRDPNLVIGIVTYLTDVQAMPQRGHYVERFTCMFVCLLEIACPNYAAFTEQFEPFFQEIEEGIATARAVYRTDD